MIHVLSYNGKLHEAKKLCQTSCLQVPWYIPFALQKLRGSFILYLFSDHEISKKFTIALDNFLAHEKHDQLILSVDVETESILETFKISILPQLRIFSCGKEIQRIYGTKNYDELAGIILPKG